MSAMPLVTDLPLLAKVLDEDPITMAMGWLIANCYELERPLRKHILEPRGVDFPDPI
jgi:hypothetical protein